MALRREYRNSLVYTLVVGWLTAIAVLWISTFISLKIAAAQGLTGQVSELLRARIEAAGAPPRISAGEEIIHASIALPLFYERRMYRPAWSGDDGPLPQADALLKAISEADREGSKPADYHLTKIEATLE
jgi:hypothetical protein